MAAPLKNLEINQIILDIAAEMDAFQVNDLKLRQLGRAIEKQWESKSISPAEFHMVKGFLAAAKHDRASAISAVKNALQLAPRDSVIQANALSVFAIFCCVYDAIELMERMLTDHPDDKSSLTHIIVHACDFIQYQLASRALKRYDNLSSQAVSEVGPRRSLLMSAPKMAEEHNFTDSDIADLIQTAVEAVRGEGCEVFRTSRTHIRDGSLIYNLHVDADTMVCAHLNFDIADALVEKFEDTKNGFITISCRPFNDMKTMRPLEKETI